MLSGHIMQFGPLDMRRTAWSRLREDERRTLREALGRPLLCVWHPGFHRSRRDLYEVELPESVDLLRSQYRELFLCMNYRRWRTILVAREYQQAARNGPVPGAVCRELVEWYGRARLVRDALILGNRGLAYKVAMQIALPSDREEYQAEALTTLIRAVDRFDAANGSTFCSYAFVSMLRALARMRAARRKASDNEQATPYLDPECRRNGTGTDHIDLRILLDSNAAKLTARERQALALRFGLEGEKACSLSDAAQKLGWSRETIRNLQASAVTKLREAFNL